MKKESGMFKLEPDKFSVHTFEISKKLTNQDYKRMREGLYRQCPKGEVYRDRDWQGEGERHRCRWFQRNFDVLFAHCGESAKADRPELLIPGHPSTD